MITAWLVGDEDITLPVQMLLAVGAVVAVAGLALAAYALLHAWLGGRRGRKEDHR